MRGRVGIGKRGGEMFKRSHWGESQHGDKADTGSKGREERTGTVVLFERMEKPAKKRNLKRGKAQKKKMARSKRRR